LRTSWLERVSQRLLLNDEDAKGEFGFVPFPDEPPKLVRVSAYALAPTRIDEYKRSGERWRVRRIGTMVGARGIQPWVEEQAVPQPELFHMDFVHYKKRAFPLREMVRLHASGQAPDQAVLAVSDLTAEEVTRFWSEFVPAVNEHRGDWARVSEHALALQERFGAVTIYRFERLLMRFSWLLRMHTEDHFVRGLPPKIELLSNWRYEMLLQEIIVDGRDAYLELLKQPSHAAERARRTTDETQLWTLAMVRYDMMIFHIRTFRWNMIGDHGHKYKIHGIFEYVPLLAKVLPPDEEWRPVSNKHDDGEFTVDGIYAAPKDPALGSRAS
jgi:hypothetical protein